MKSIVQCVGFGSLSLWSCLGCSFLGEQPPPDVPTHYARGEKPCKPSNIQYPIADTLSTLAGVTWVIWANQKIDDADAAAKAADPYGNDNPDDTSYKVARAAGYGAIGIFAAAAIYGFVIEGQCASYRHSKAAPSSPNGGASTHGFPISVLDFAWNTDSVHAAQTCAARGQQWFLEGSVGLCQSKVPSAAHPDVKLEFELGHPARIVVLYRSAPQAMNENYQQILGGLRKTYGAPQTDAAHISTACASSLAQCLADGEHPQGPRWSWANGSIELAPVWQEDQALLELRYTRTDAQAE